ncbi:MAG: UPF0149 family protein [Legionellaceae bacterium]|nr:UPF0149 family protein [Legionellaceae bacterium]
MSSIAAPMQLPNYRTFIDSISVLDLPISGSELHGVLCGYLAAGAHREGEGYLRSLMLNRTEESDREAARAIFSVYTVSQQQITNFGFEFQLMLPDDHEPLYDRARAFSEWCEGFSQGITIAGIDLDALKSDEAQEAVQHMVEFADLDYDALEVNEEDERALMEVVEYTRMAILSIYTDILADKLGGTETAH